jgi:hypothetical protein
VSSLKETKITGNWQEEIIKILVAEEEVGGKHL